MFTGCIKNIGKLLRREIKDVQGKVTISTQLAESVKQGESIAVNGICLTVESINGKANTLDFHVLAESFKRTSLANLEVDSLVNLEQALRVGDRLDGHIVTGHIDYRGQILSTSTVDNDRVIDIELKREFQPLVVEKGSIAIDGVSLTVAAVKENSFSVHLIPYTLNNTNFSEIHRGNYVNIETDIIGKYVARSKTLNIV